MNGNTMGFIIYIYIYFAEVLLQFGIANRRIK